MTAIQTYTRSISVTATGNPASGKGDRRQVTRVIPEGGKLAAAGLRLVTGHSTRQPGAACAVGR
jgi:hypothetical protein